MQKHPCVAVPPSKFQRKPRLRNHYGKRTRLHSFHPPHSLPSSLFLPMASRFAKLSLAFFLIQTVRSALVTHYAVDLPSTNFTEGPADACLGAGFISSTQQGASVTDVAQGTHFEIDTTIKFLTRPWQNSRNCRGCVFHQSLRWRRRRNQH